MSRKKKAQWLCESDAHHFKLLCPDIKYISWTCSASDKIIEYKKRRIITTLRSCQSDHLRGGNMNIAYGRLFSTAEQKNRSRVCIIGSKAAEELFKAAPALGKVITIDKEPFTVIGVLKKMENFSAFYDRNLSIFIPLPIGRRLFHTTLPSTAIHTIHAVGYDTTNMHRLERSLRRALRVRHRLSKTDPDDFSIWNQAGMAAAAEQSSQTLNLFLLIVASLSLLVGGIGVSNIMLVSVTERTKEIGIRLAIGASPSMILAQFLIESIMLCGIGGILGIVLGVTAPYIVTLFTDWLVIITPLSIILSVLLTMVIGVVFGFLPARRAASMNVVEALYDR